MKRCAARSGGELFIESKYQHFPPIYTKQFQPFQMRKGAARAVNHSFRGWNHIWGQEALIL